MHKHSFPFLILLSLLAACNMAQQQSDNNNNSAADSLAAVKMDTLANTFLAYAFPQALEANYQQVKETWKETERRLEPSIHKTDFFNEYLTYTKDSSMVQYLSSDSNFTAINATITDNMLLTVVNDMALDSIPDKKNKLFITDLERRCSAQVSFANDTISAFSFSLALDENVAPDEAVK